MILTIHFKTPDAVYYAVREAVEYLEPDDPSELELYDGDVDMWRQHQQEQLRTKLDRWVKFGEFVSIEFDTDADTARVKPATEQ